MNNPQESFGSIRPASTVVLVREVDQGLQVYLLQRSAGSGFFPGSYVFPGGGLNPDEGEAEFWQQHLDLQPQDLLRVFGSGLDRASLIAYGVAAIRETFEEAGIFLARKETAIPRLLGPGTRQQENKPDQREASKSIFVLEDGNNSLGRIDERPSTAELAEGWLRRKVSEEGWLLSFSNLFPWSHWITPEVMPKRFDTRFFIAFMPEGQECAPDNRETVHGLWVSPRKGLQENRLGRIPLSPPTLITLHELLKFETLNSLKQEIRSRSWGDPRQPIQVRFDQGIVLVQPWDPHYGKPIIIDPESLKEKIVPVGEPFSRLWLNEGIWRPVRI